MRAVVVAANGTPYSGTKKDPRHFQGPTETCVAQLRAPPSKVAADGGDDDRGPNRSISGLMNGEDSLSVDARYEPSGP